MIPLVRYKIPNSSIFAINHGFGGFLLQSRLYASCRRLDDDEAGGREGQEETSLGDVYDVSWASRAVVPRNDVDEGGGRTRVPKWQISRHLSNGP